MEIAVIPLDPEAGVVIAVDHGGRLDDVQAPDVPSGMEPQQLGDQFDAGVEPLQAEVAGGVDLAAPVVDGVGVDGPVELQGAVEAPLFILGHGVEEHLGLVPDIPVVDAAALVAVGFEEAVGQIVGGEGIGPGLEHGGVGHGLGDGGVGVVPHDPGGDPVHDLTRPLDQGRIRLVPNDAFGGGVGLFSRRLDHNGLGDLLGRRIVTGGQGRLVFRFIEHPADGLARLLAHRIGGIQGRAHDERGGHGLGDGLGLGHIPGGNGGLVVGIGCDGLEGLSGHGRVLLGNGGLIGVGRGPRRREPRRVGLGRLGPRELGRRLGRRLDLGGPVRRLGNGAGGCRIGRGPDHGIGVVQGVGEILECGADPPILGQGVLEGGGGLVHPLGGVGQVVGGSGKVLERLGVDVSGNVVAHAEIPVGLRRGDEPDGGPEAHEDVLLGLDAHPAGPQDLLRIEIVGSGEHLFRDVVHDSAVLRGIRTHRGHGRCSKAKAEHERQATTPNQLLSQLHLLSLLGWFVLRGCIVMGCFSSRPDWYLPPPFPGGDRPFSEWNHGAWIRKK